MVRSLVMEPCKTIHIIRVLILRSHIQGIIILRITSTTEVAIENNFSRVTNYLRRERLTSEIV